MIQPFTIVVGHDFTPRGGFAFAQAARIARRIPASEIHLVHVFRRAHAPAELLRLREQLDRYVEEKSAFLDGMGDVATTIHLVDGTDTARELARVARSVMADFIFVGGARHRHIRRRMTDRLVALASCPVLLAAKPATTRAAEPTVEPPCPDCIEARATLGPGAWCARHSHHRHPAHRYSYEREVPFETHDSEVVPTGIDF